VRNAAGLDFITQRAFILVFCDDHERDAAMESADDATHDEQQLQEMSKPAALAKSTKMEAKRRQKASKLPGKPRKLKAVKAEAEGAVPAYLNKNIKKPHRFKPGTTALREIRRYQKTGEELTQTAPFDRAVRAMVDQCSNTGDLRLTAIALKAVKVASEYFLTELFQRAQAVNNLTEHDTLRDVEVRHAAIHEMGLSLPSNGKMACSDLKLKRMQRAEARATARRIKGAR
jgi:histone H3/H4